MPQCGGVRAEKQCSQKPSSNLGTRRPSTTHYYGSLHGAVHLRPQGYSRLVERSHPRRLADTSPKVCQKLITGAPNTASVWISPNTRDLAHKKHEQLTIIYSTQQQPRNKQIAKTGIKPLQKRVRHQ